MDEDDPWLRQPWEDADPPPRQTLGGPATGTEALLIPLARAQDAVARLEASPSAAPDNAAAGLRAWLALFEAAGFLARCGPAVHPHDLALRGANLTGSYTPRRAHRPAGSPMDDRLKAQARFLKADKPSR